MSNFSIEDILSDRMSVTIGLAVISIGTTAAVNAITNIINRKKDPLVIDKNFIEQMRAGTIDIPNLAERFKDIVVVDQDLLNEIKAGTFILTEDDILMMAPLVSFTDLLAQPNTVTPGLINTQQPTNVQYPQGTTYYQQVAPNPVNTQQPIAGQVAPVTA